MIFALSKSPHLLHKMGFVDSLMQTTTVSLYLQASKGDIKNGNGDAASNSDENQDDDEADVVIESEESLH